MTNEKVTSIKRCKKYSFETQETTDLGIDRFSIWDGESYRDQYFCNRTQCAVRYAYMVVEKSGLASVAYNDAMKRQRGDKVA